MIHAGSLYTQSRTASGPARAYGQEQINQRYGVIDKASVDPFTAMVTYSQRFEKSKRTLPDFSTFPFCAWLPSPRRRTGASLGKAADVGPGKEFFPPELHATLDGLDGPQGVNGRRPKRRKVLELQDAKQMAFGNNENQADGRKEDDKKALSQLAKFESLPENQENTELDLVEDEEDYDEVEDEVYEDDEEGDYNAEGFFDGGDDDMEDDYGEEGAAEEATYN